MCKISRHVELNADETCLNAGCGIWIQEDVGNRMRMRTPRA